LDLNDGNKTHTAEQLRIGSATLYRKLKRYGLIGTKRPSATCSPS
jgi:DNA-binding NtrC family response regulator